MADARRSSANDVVGVDHPGQSVRHRRQTQPRPACHRLRRVLSARPGSWHRCRGMVPAGRRRHRHVAAADDGRHRTDRRLDPPVPARVQRPGRVPGRGRGDGGGDQPRRGRRGVVAGAGQLPPGRRRDGALRRSRRQRARKAAGRPRWQGADDPQLRRHRADPPGRPDDQVPGGAGDRRRTRCVVRRQRRILTVARPRRRRRPAASRRDLRGQRGRLDARRPGGAVRGSTECPVRKLRPGRSPRRAARHGRSPRRAAAPGPRPRQRPVEDVLDPRRRAARARRHRRRNDDPAHPRRVGGRRQRCSRRRRKVHCGRCRPRRRPPTPRRHGRGGTAVGRVGSVPSSSGRRLRDIDPRNRAWRRRGAALDPGGEQ